MNEEDSIFDIDDTIVITKKKIILTKNKHLETKNQKTKFKELDGTWELDVVEEDKTILDKEILDDDIIYDAYIDMIDKSVMTDILSEITLHDFKEYIMYCKKVKHEHDYVWELYEEHKLYGLKKPSKKEWSSHYIIDIFNAYNYYFDEYNLDIGNPEDFITFCYENSDTKRICKY